MILPVEYLMGRDKADPLTPEMFINMCDLLARVNYLFGRLDLSAPVTSGYRPAFINSSIGGAKKSTHLMCQGIDILDKHGNIAILLSKRTDLLEKYGLYMESPNHTRKEINGVISSWVHLQSKKTLNRIFIP